MTSDLRGKALHERLICIVSMDFWIPETENMKLCTIIFKVVCVVCI